MTKILEKAIAKVRTLPAEDQDMLGAVLLALADEELTHIGELDDETRAAVREGLEQAKRGESVPEEEIKALWQRLGL
jgi:hypothetical protein